MKKTKNNKPSSLKVKEESLKVIHTKKNNKKDKDETMNNSYNKEKDEDKGMTLESEPSNSDPPNTGQLIYRYDETETT